MVPNAIGRRAAVLNGECAMRNLQSRFDLSDLLVPIRMLCGLLYVPHIVYKLAGMEGAAAFFAKAGFHCLTSALTRQTEAVEEERVLGSS